MKSANFHIITIIITLTLIVLAVPMIVSAQTPTFSCADVTEIPQTECEALVALYNSTGGDSWNTNTNWLVTNTPSDWYGVTVISGHVTSLNHFNNNLTGSIPPELGSLTALQRLSLHYNQLSGDIPTELGNLTGLEMLALDHNQLSGDIPTELFNLTALQSLYLSSNQLTGDIPTELGNLEALQWLYLQYNQLTGSIPTEMGNLTTLRMLFLHSNQLTGSIPLNFVNLSILEYFYFSNTNLCEPTTAEYLAWKSTVMDYQGTGVSCEIEDIEYSVFLPAMQK